MKHLALLLSLLAAPALAQSERAQMILDEAAETCESIEAGALEVRDGAIISADLDGDGMSDDEVVDFEYVSCEWNMAHWHGTGGSPIHFVIDGSWSKSWWGFKWETVDFAGERVILLARHGSRCDNFGASPCVQAFVAYDGEFQTVLDPGSAEEDVSEE
ncbi:hypothetical protein [Pelagovum pacificum]|uniref:Uncharacterized protein n=1 Tax=Pelagovum pacificum TaxID=2588711 RepID=A0A5C5GGF1_9RHOB|nr:hypothetical protein [Pelagovum pacificum]QQA43220.1 hypothetical protein I8N54_01210 [Pelagovum pacificum]TNY33640.1 hypothetical protein FHY64_10310 [Pelagovum pacificum]